MNEKTFYSPAKRVSQIKWNNKNLEKVKEYGRVCYEKLKTDPERLQAKREYARRYYAEHREQICLNQRLIHQKKIKNKE